MKSLKKCLIAGCLLSMASLSVMAGDECPCFSLSDLNALGPNPTCEQLNPNNTVFPGQNVFRASGQNASSARIVWGGPESTPGTASCFFSPNPSEVLPVTFTGPRAGGGLSTCHRLLVQYCKQ